MNLLQIEKVSKKYPQQISNAVEDISFNLAKGEIIAIVGENGSGKTTLLKVINGLTDADTGYVTFNGEAVKGPASNLVPGHQQIKMLYQEFNLFPKHTIKENIGYNLRYFSNEEQERKTKELIKLCRLEGMENKLPSELSGGQQQRVALAKAIADEPLLLLMDEPFSNLDLFLKDEIKKKVIQKIREQGNSAIFITHDLKDALALADRIAVMRKGQLLQLDTPQNVYERPSDEYIAYLFGNVNILTESEFTQNFKLPENKNLKKLTKSSKVCIRPEHIMLCKEEKCQSKGVVKNVAYLGDSYELEVEFNKVSIRVNTRKKQVNKGDKVFFKINPAKVHVI
jgi:iron(III) transport system ATP-binding protein